MKVEAIIVDGKKYIAAKYSSKCVLCDLYSKCMESCESEGCPCLAFNTGVCILKEVKDEIKNK